MSSTNKTTNYELSQYIGSDMPTYLGDYNSDMLKIDTQMKANNTLGNTADGKADTNALAIGTLANLNTTVKSNLVGAVNEVKDIEGFPAYSENDTYSIGDYAVYEGKLYKCTTAISTPESFNSSHWTETSIKTEVSIESGSNANGYYIKYPDGTMICNKIAIVNTTINNAWGTWYDSGPKSLGSFAQTFYAVPTITAVLTGGWSALIQRISDTTTSSVGDVYLTRSTQLNTAQDHYVNIIAIGRWKA